MIAHHLANAAREIPTPFYLLDLDSVRASYRTMDRAWRAMFPHVTLAYSFKSNSLESVVDLMRREGSGAEVVSGAELQLALRAGFEADRIVFDGPVKRDEELALALTHGVRIHVDGVHELSRITRQARALGVEPLLGARLQTHYRGRPSRFGFSPDELARAEAHLHPSKFLGIHLHIGSNLNDPEVYAAAIELHGKTIAATLRREGSWLDVGGGFPASSVGGGSTPKPPHQFAQAVARALEQIGVSAGTVPLLLEPGRCLVEDAGYLVLTCVARKDRGPRPLLFMDGGGDLVRSIHTWHHPITWVGSDPARSLDAEYFVFGSNCFESDLLCAGLPGPRSAGPGDRIIVGSAGAYDLTTAGAWIRSCPRVVGVVNDRREVLRGPRPPHALAARASKAAAKNPLQIINTH